MKKLLEHLPPVTAWPYIAFGLLGIVAFVATGGLTMWGSLR